MDAQEVPFRKLCLIQSLIRNQQKSLREEVNKKKESSRQKKSSRTKKKVEQKIYKKYKRKVPSGMHETF